jgi:hypothetical protein
LGSAGDSSVKAERLSEPENPQQDHEHQRQYGGRFSDLGTAGLAG